MKYSCFDDWIANFSHNSSSHEWNTSLRVKEQQFRILWRRDFFSVFQSLRKFSAILGFRINVNKYLTEKMVKTPNFIVSKTSTDICRWGFPKKLITTLNSTWEDIPKMEKLLLPKGWGHLSVTLQLRTVISNSKAEDAYQKPLST